MKNMSILEQLTAEVSLLHRAVCALAGMCDGAYRQDGAGFNKFDSDFGKSLSTRPWSIWTPAQKRAAWKMLKKYKEQLGGVGIDYDLIPEPEQVASALVSADPPKPSEPVFSGRKISIIGEQVTIEFPFDADLVEQVKLIPGRSWRPAQKHWVVPLNASTLEPLKQFAQTNHFAGDDRLAEHVDRAAAFIAESVEASKAADADFNVDGLGGVLRPFQRAGVKYAADKKRCIIADQPGLGKTAQSLATVHHLDAYPCLVVCPATLKFNWLREAQNWLPGKSFQVLGGNATGRANADVTIVNYDRLKAYQEFLIRRGYKSIIADESTALKSPTAQRTIIFEEIANGCLYGRNGKRADRRKKEQIGTSIPVRLLLSGTPVMNRPNELIPQLQIINRLNDFGGWRQFNKDYCDMFETRWGVDNSGAKNLVQLNTRLRAICMVRREKSEVLKELPPKVRTVIPVEISNRSEYDRAEADLIQWLKETKGQEKANAAIRAEQLVRIGALKQLAAQGKIGAAKEWIEDFLDTERKLVVFGWHKVIVEEIAREFKCGQITGDTSLQLRDQHVQAFQADPTVKTLACNIQAGGMGLTLTAASDVIFLELGWNPSQHDQAGDRCHRIGQTDSVTEWWLIGKGTIDEDIHELIESKRAVVDAATDGREQVAEVNIMSELVSRLRGEDRGGEAAAKPARRQTANDSDLELI